MQIVLKPFKRSITKKNDKKTCNVYRSYVNYSSAILFTALCKTCSYILVRLSGTYIIPLFNIP